MTATAAPRRARAPADATGTAAVAQLYAKRASTCAHAPDVEAAHVVAGPGEHGLSGLLLQNATLV